MRYTILIWLLGVTVNVFAQKTISGQVIDSKGNPIPYVNIGIIGSKTGTLSDIKGISIYKTPIH